MPKDQSFNKQKKPHKQPKSVQTNQGTNLILSILTWSFSSLLCNVCKVHHHFIIFIIFIITSSSLLFLYISLSAPSSLSPRSRKWLHDTNLRTTEMRMKLKQTHVESASSRVISDSYYRAFMSAEDLLVYRTSWGSKIRS